MASKLRNKTNQITIPEDNIVFAPEIVIKPENINKPKSSLRNKENKISTLPEENNDLSLRDVKDYTLETLSNVIPSTGQYIKDVVTPFTQPVQTYNAVKDMFVGFKQLKERDTYIKNNPNKPKPKLTQQMIMAEAVNKHFAERYGDWVGNETDDYDVIAKKMATTFKKDPAGVMGDISGILSFGTIGAAKYAGKAGRIAQNIAKYSDPIAGVGAATGRVGLVAGSIGSGKSIESLKEAYIAAEADKFYNPFKSSSNKAFKNAQKGKTTEIDILNDLSNKTKLYRNELSNNYGDWVKGLPDNPNSNLKTFNQIIKELDNVKYGGEKPLYTQKFTDIDIPNPIGLLDESGNVITTKGTKTQNIKRVDNAEIKDLRKIENLVNPYVNNIELQTPQSLAQLKSSLSNLKLSTNKFNNFKKTINNQILDDLTKIDSSTPIIMKNYGDMSNSLKDLDVLISGNIISKPTNTGNPSQIFKTQNYQTAINKANAIIGDLQKSKIADDISAPILKKIGSDLKPSLAGLNLQDSFSPNTGRLAAGMVATKLGSEFTQGSPIAAITDSLLAAEAAALPLTSPRFVANTSNLLGVGNRFGLGTSTGGRGISLLGNPLASSTVRPYPLEEEDLSDINFSLFNNKPYRGLFE